MPSRLLFFFFLQKALLWCYYFSFKWPMIECCDLSTYLGLHIHQFQKYCLLSITSRIQVTCTVVSEILSLFMLDHYCTTGIRNYRLKIISKQLYLGVGRLLIKVCFSTLVSNLCLTNSRSINLGEIRTPQNQPTKFNLLLEHCGLQCSAMRTFARR